METKASEEIKISADTFKEVRIITEAQTAQISSLITIRPHKTVTSEILITATFTEVERAIITGTDSGDVVISRDIKVNKITKIMVIEISIIDNDITKIRDIILITPSWIPVRWASKGHKGQ